MQQAIYKNPGAQPSLNHEIAVNPIHFVNFSHLKNNTMRKTLLIIFSVLAANLIGQVNPSAGSTVILNNETDSLNFYLGMKLGFDIQGAPFETVPSLIVQGFQLAFEENSGYDPMTAQEIIRQIQMSMSEKAAAEANQSAQENLFQGASFLLENANREEVTTTATGLQYMVLTMGEGPLPADTSVVTVNYEGTLLNGTVFDSSYERGEPISFPLDRVIAGWTEGVQLMPVGSTFIFYIPSDLAYGPQGKGPIPGNSVLIFKIELLGFE